MQYLCERSHSRSRTSAPPAILGILAEAAIVLTEADDQLSEFLDCATNERWTRAGFVPPVGETAYHRLYGELARELRGPGCHVHCDLPFAAAFRSVSR
jgi:hypothetical protein